jgi:hypothetical protein
MSLDLPGYIVRRKEVAICEHKEDDNMLLSLWTFLRQLKSTILQNILEQTYLPRYRQKKAINFFQ